MRRYHARIELLDANQSHIRFLPGPLAEAMVNRGGATIANANGKVKSVQLAQPASWFAQRIGPPTGDWGGVRFSVREKLEGGHVVWRHHPRCTYER